MVGIDQDNSEPSPSRDGVTMARYPSNAPSLTPSAEPTNMCPERSSDVERLTRPTIGRHKLRGTPAVFRRTLGSPPEVQRVLYFEPKKRRCASIRCRLGRSTVTDA